MGWDSVVSIATWWGLDSQESNPAGDNILHARPDWPWSPPSLLYNGFWGSFSEEKQPGGGIEDPPPSSTEVKERVELYLYSTSEPSWPVLG